MKMEYKVNELIAEKNKLESEKSKMKIKIEILKEQIGEVQKENINLNKIVSKSNKPVSLYKATGCL